MGMVMNLVFELDNNRQKIMLTGQEYAQMKAK